MKNKTISMNMNEFIRNNAWQIIVASAVFIWGYSMLNAKQQADAQAITVLQARMAQYPSADYFNLKFQDLTDKLTEQTSQLSQLKLQLTGK